MVKVKVCGVTRREDARALDELVDYIGVIVDPLCRSPRYVDERRAREIVAECTRAAPVAVIAIPESVDVARRLDVNVVQYHSDIQVERARELCRQHSIRFAPVVAYRDGDDALSVALRVSSLCNLEDVEYVLVDSDKSSARRYEHDLKVPLSVIERAVRSCGMVGVAGGITVDNVRQVLALRPYLVDVSSGVEVRPGVKSLDLVLRLVNIVREHG